MVQRILFCLVLLTSSGCAYLASRQTCDITSSPPGASLTLVSAKDPRARGTRLGTTPYLKPVPQGMEPGVLRVELAGYETAMWPLPNALKFSHHFELEPAISVQVAGELATYPREYVRGAVDVLGKCDEVLAAPRVLVGTAAASANTANERLKLDYPELKASVLSRKLDGTIDELRALGSLSYGGDWTPTEHGAVLRAEHLIREIKQGLGVR